MSLHWNIPGQLLSHEGTLFLTKKYEYFKALLALVKQKNYAPCTEKSDNSFAKAMLGLAKLLRGIKNEL